jgi:deoxyribonuclease-4
MQNALARAHALGCTAVQLFSHNPRGWRTDEIADEEALRFRALSAELDISPVYVHASYLINVASFDGGLRAKSAALLREEMGRADFIGAGYVVLHAGNAHDGEAGRLRAMDSIAEALGRGGYRAGLLIENTSGKRGDIASTVGELAAIMEGSGGLVAGVCLDTCHAFAAGYDLAAKAGRERLVSEIRDLLGVERLRLIHLNDSRGAMGSGVDRHEHIGRGKIGAEALGLFVRQRAIRGVPLILETPKKSDEDDPRNLRLAREIM